MGHYATNMKSTWEQRDRFEATLIRSGWRVYRTLKKSTIYEKDSTRIEVDDFGLFMWEYQKGVWLRTHGLSDDRVDEGYRRENNSNILKFKANRSVKRFNLVEAAWVK